LTDNQLDSVPAGPGALLRLAGKSLCIFGGIEPANADPKPTATTSQVG